MWKILSTNLLTYNWYNSSRNFNKILSVPKKIDYSVRQIPGESTFLPVLTYGTAIENDFIVNYVNYIPEVPSSWEWQWTLNPEDIAIHSDSVTWWAMLECYYRKNTWPSTFTFWSAPVATDFTSQIQSWHSGCNVPEGQVKYTLAWDDWYYYCTVPWTPNWSDMNLECIKLDNTMTPIAHNSVATSWWWSAENASVQTFYSWYSGAMSYWTQYVDPSIVDYQTLWEWIYNQL